MREMPTLGPPPKKSPVSAILMTALIIGLISGGSFWLGRISRPAPKAPAPATEQPTVEVAPTPQHPVAEKERVVDAGPTIEINEAWKKAEFRIDGPLETAFVNAVGTEVGPSLTQVVTRLLVWWVDVPQGLHRGDTLSVIYEEIPGAEPLVHMVKFQSSQKKEPFVAFRFQAPQAEFGRYYSEDGQEIEERLSPSPIESYEQITSLLRDGRRHQGVDFKAPVGTPVKATFDGTITRRNWNFRSNGNCLEITDSKTGRQALYLHLSELPANMRVGTRVKVGQVIAASGNSGRSFAPHLHYQLMANERALDPFKIHRTRRAQIDSSHLEKLRAEVSTMNSQYSVMAASP